MKFTQLTVSGLASGEVDVSNVLSRVRSGAMAIAFTDHGELKAFLVPRSKVEQQPTEDSVGVRNFCTDLTAAIELLSEDRPALSVVARGRSVAVLVHPSLKASLGLPLIGNPDTCLSSSFGQSDG